MTGQTLRIPPPPGIRADRVVTPADRGPAPGPLTETKSEAAVRADQRSAPHSSPGVLMASDNTWGGETNPSSVSQGDFSLFRKQNEGIEPDTTS